MFGSGGAGSPLNARPEITIALRGPVNAPKRTIDAAALANWLALRAVEQQSKKLDALEGREAVSTTRCLPRSIPTRNLLRTSARFRGPAGLLVSGAPSGGDGRGPGHRKQSNAL